MIDNIKSGMQNILIERISGEGLTNRERIPSQSIVQSSDQILFTTTGMQYECDSIYRPNLEGSRVIPESRESYQERIMALRHCLPRDHCYDCHSLYRVEDVE